MKPIVNIDELDMKHMSRGSRFEDRAGRIGGVIGMKDLGAQYIVVPPGKAGFPFHAHRNNEEMFIILEGVGAYRCGSETYPVRAGDVISAVAGDASTAHQLTNTGSSDLRGKFMVASGIPAGGGMMAAEFVLRGRDKPLLDYWDGEPGAEVEGAAK